MLVHEETLPGAELQLALRYRNAFGRPREYHSDVAWHVVRPFQSMSKVSGIFRYQTSQEMFKVCTCTRVSILKEYQAGAGMLNKNSGHPGPNPALYH